MPGLTEKSARSQLVAATLSRASRGSVPTHGWSTRGTGGRSASTSRPATSPTRTGAIVLRAGSVAQPAPGIVVHRPLMAPPRKRVSPCTSVAASSAVRVERRRHDRAGAGDPDDVRGGRAAPAAEVEQPRLVADAGDGVRGDQLHPGGHAPAVPAHPGPTPARRAVRRRTARRTAPPTSPARPCRGWSRRCGPGGETPSGSA